MARTHVRLIVVIMAATGCIPAIEEELKHIVHPNRYYVENIGRNKLSLAELTEKAEKHFLKD